MKFTYQPNPVHVLFGSPLPEALKTVLQDIKSIQKLWIVASNRHNPLVEQISKLECVEVVEQFSRVLPHVPADQVQKARHHVAKRQPDILLSIGGGSATGLAKAVALKHSVTFLAAPTTFSGSEMTDIYGITAEGRKEVGRDLSVLPDIAIYDPSLTLTLPKVMAAQSALNALAHLTEAIYSVDNNPYTYNHAQYGIRVLYDGLKKLSAHNAIEPDVNEQLILGSSIAGKCLSEVGMALQHKAAHVLAGNFGLEHAGVHSVLLPYVLAYQWRSLSSSIKTDIQHSFGSKTPAEDLLILMRQLEIPTTLNALGFRKTSVREAAEQILHLPFKNPAPLDSESLMMLLEDAFEGKLPEWEKIRTSHVQNENG